MATALVLLSPPVLIEAVAGLALLGALAAAVAAAVAEPESREAAVVTFVVTASGVSLLGVAGAFWGLLAGWLMLLLFRRRAASPPAGPAGAATPAGPPLRPRCRHPPARRKTDRVRSARPARPRPDRVNSGRTGAGRIRPRRPRPAARSRGVDRHVHRPVVADRWRSGRRPLWGLLVDRGGRRRVPSAH
nr:benzoate/H(+) symporter BenE family transporter [Micromonospora sp. 4G55]